MSHVHPPPYSSNSEYRRESLHSAKRPRLHSAQPKSNSFPSSSSAISRIYRYPEHLPKLKRAVHAPCRVLRFGIRSDSLENSSPRPGARRLVDCTENILGYKFNLAKRHVLECMKEVMHVEDEAVGKEKAVIVLDDDSSMDGCSEAGVQEFEDISVISVDSAEKNNHLAEISHEAEVNGFKDALINEDVRVDDAGKMLHMLSLNPNVNELSVPLFERLRCSALRRDTRLKELKFQIELNESRRSSFRVPSSTKVVKLEAFVPLTEDEEEEVSKAFSAKRNKVLVNHENSNIVITGEVFQCLRPGTWLNDEVINVYLELLKEREKREPKKFLKCHFFNTFFYKKLTNGKNGYDFKSVRRWTTLRKLGYSLVECDKIFVPIHREIHWCLAVINKKDARFQYLDSLGGQDKRVLEVLARYIIDEAKDKGGDINISDWKKEFEDGLPEQENGSDCGMFMIKYIDFYSRGWDLCFKQEDMPYFRSRTAKEILSLRAE